MKEHGEEWIFGNVLKAVGNLNDDECEFEVKYDDEEEILIVKLYEDCNNGDLSVIWRSGEMIVMTVCCNEIYYTN